MKVGAFVFLKKKKNVVISNAIGAAAYHGKIQMLRHLLDNIAGSAKEFEAMEH